MINNLQAFDMYAKNTFVSERVASYKRMMRLCVLRTLIAYDRLEAHEADPTNKFLRDRMTNALHNAGEYSGYMAALYSRAVGNVDHKWRDIVFAITKTMFKS